jgi:hypothetical protein
MFYLVDMGKVGSVLLIITLFFLSTLSLISFSTTAGPLTQVAVDTVSQEAKVDVSPGSTGVTSAQINVECQTLDPTPVTVQLSVNCPGIAASISPSGMVFQTIGTSNMEAIVDITVPLESIASELTCTIEGSWEQGIFSGQVSSTSIRIIVMPYYRVRLSCESPINETCQGEGGSFNFSIKNMGNCDDVYQLEIANREELNIDNISIPDTDKIAISRGNAMKIEMDVRTSFTTPVKNYTLIMVVTSLGSKTESDITIYEELPLFLTVKEGLHTDEKTKVEQMALLLSPSIMIMMVLIVYIIIALIYKSSR